MNRTTLNNAACPNCGGTGMAVSPLTLRSMVKHADLDQVDGFRFCRSAECHVAYYNPDTLDVYTTSSVSVAIGHKSHSTDRMICYCFELTAQDIVDRSHNPATTDAMEFIAKRCRDGRYRCETMNPQGRCCLTEVRQAAQSTPPPGEAEARRHPGPCCPESDALRPQPGGRE